MDYVTEIKKFTFDKTNPFDVDKTFFENVRSELGDQEYERFIQECYYFALTNTHRLEAFVIYVYQRAAQALEPGPYRDYFMTMSSEEQVHTDMMSEMEYLLYGNRRVYSEKDFSSELDKFMLKFDVTTMLSRFFIGETKLVMMFAAFYKHCQDLEKKKFIGEFIAEETRHTNQMLEALGKRLESLDDSHRQELYNTVIKDIMERSYWATPVVSRWFDSHENANGLYKLAYSSEVAGEYLDKSIRRLYQMAQIIIPGLEYDRFRRDVLLPQLAVI